MILFYSDECEYAAKKTAIQTEDDVVCITENVRNNTPATFESFKTWTVITCLSEGRIPEELSSWLLTAKLSENREIYFVFTAGTDTSRAEAEAERLASRKDMMFMGCADIGQCAEGDPEADARIHAAAGIIKENLSLQKHKKTIIDRINGLLGKL